MNRQRRRITAVSTAVLSLAVLAGCSAGGGSTSTTSGSQSITVATLKAAYFDGCMSAVIPEFTAETGINVELAALPYDGMFDKYQATFASGQSSYDLMTIAFQWTGGFAANGFLEPVDPSAVEGVSKTLVDQYVYSGTEYGVPFNSSVMGMFYRTDILAKMGETFPDTQEGLQALLAKLAADPDLKAQGILPTSVMGDKTQGMANFNTIYHSLGGPAFENDKSEPNPIDVGIAAQAFRNLKSQIEYSPAGALTATFSSTPSQFASGTVAMLPVWNTTAGNTFESADSKVKGNYAFAATPGGAGDLGGWGNVVPASSSNKEAAAKFAAYLASPKVDLECSLEAGKSPVQEENFTNPDLLATTPYLPEVVNVLATGVPRYTGEKAGTLNDIVDSVTSQFLAGQLGSADEAAQKLADQIAAAA